MTIRLQLFIGFSILILIFVIDFFVNQRLSREVIINTNYVSNSEAVIRNSNVLHKNSIDMQSGFRGFLLTEQESFLDTYTEGVAVYPQLLREQRALITSEIQQRRLDSIEALQYKWIDYASALISAKRDTLPEASAKYKELFEQKLKKEVGKKYNDQIKTIFSHFDSYEYQVRQYRRKMLQNSIERTRSITISLTILSIALAIISSLYFIRNITGRISKMVALADKIAKGDFRQIEDKKNDELKKLSESLNSMSRILDKNIQELLVKNKELDQFAYVVSHDLKAPLRGIANITSWLEEDHAEELTPAVKQNLELIKGRTRRLENMINGLLEYARIGKGKKELLEVDVRQLLNEITEELVPAGFITELKGDLPVFTTEKLYLEQVFANLISNAVKYNNKAQGKIVIEGTDKGDHYQFSVSDNGTGIQQEYFEKIFLIFQTLRERDAFESTGVGLAIVKKIIDDHQQKIWVESKYGHGATFTFTWPKVTKSTR
jgi:signal transduction histidine kinase